MQHKPSFLLYDYFVRECGQKYVCIIYYVSGIVCLISICMIDAKIEAYANKVELVYLPSGCRAVITLWQL